MYTYKNKKTGEVIQTTNKVSGGNWEPVEAKKAATAPKSAEAPKAAAPKAAAKNVSKGKKPAAKAATPETTDTEEKGGQ